MWEDHKILCNLATNRQSSFNTEIPKNPNFVAYSTANDESIDATYTAQTDVFIQVLVRTVSGGVFRTGACGRKNQLLRKPFLN
jgi:hypothetical protein